MPDHTTSDAALRACKFLAVKFGYVVVCFVPNEKAKMPKGKCLGEYANVPLFGRFLRVTVQTRAADFVKQCDALFDNKLLHTKAPLPQDGSRFFRCTLEEDSEIPF
jgi:hypothetical protein